MCTSYTAFVDKKYGNDLCAQLETPCYPFATIVAAIRAINLTRFPNENEGWVVRISPGDFGSLTLDTVNGIQFEGSGKYTKVGPITLVNCGIRLKPDFMNMTIPGSVMTATPTLLSASVGISALSLLDSNANFDSVIIDDVAQTESSSILLENSSMLFRSGVVNSSSNSAPVVWSFGSSIDPNQIDFSNNLFNIPSISETSVVEIASPQTKAILGGNSFNFGEIFGDVAIYSSNSDASSSLIASDTFVTQELLGPSLLRAAVGALLIAKNEGEGKIAVSTTRMEIDTQSKISQKNGGGSTDVQLTTYGSKTSPPNLENFVNENSNDKSNSLWMKGGLSLGTLYANDPLIRYQVLDEHYSVFLDSSAGSVSADLPQSSERIGRIISLNAIPTNPNVVSYVYPDPGDKIIFGLETFTDANPLVLGYGGIGQYAKVIITSIETTTEKYWLGTI